MKYLLQIYFAVISSVSFAQQDSVTAADYARAENFLPYTTQQYIDNAFTYPNWISKDKFWYRILTAKGSNFILVDAAKGTRTEVFDQSKLIEALAPVTGTTYQPYKLPFKQIYFSPGEKSVSFTIKNKQWNLDLNSYDVTPDSSAPKKKITVNQNEVLSPDSTKAAFIKDYNLWIRDIATNNLIQLTTDGEQYFGYATDNAGWKHSNKAILRWSPDSKKIATFKQDERSAGFMYLVSTNVGHPNLEAWKYPLPGDSSIITIQRVIIDIDSPKVIFLNVPADPHRASLSDDISSSGTFDDVDWSYDSKQLAFVSTSRDHKVEKFRIANANTGEVKDVFEEDVPTQYESGQGTINWKFLKSTNEIIWYSERDNWGHLYLYDAVTGKLKNKITRGSFVVTRIFEINENTRTVYFLADGREPGNPYYSYFYRVNFDGSNLTLLTPGTGNHMVLLSPANNYIIDTYSQPDVPPVTELRTINGKLVTKLEQTDLTRLQASGWKPPIQISVRAHDDSTICYGLMYTPTNFDSTKSYPVIDYIYPGPQGGSVGSWSFSASRGDNQALAELGFIIVEIEGTSNPLRSKSYHDMSYGFMAENTLPDQIAGIRQLAERYNYLDTTRIGIWGHSGGGFATACAMFKYPDFFKVGISESGNHDNRNYEDDWGERYIGLLTKDSNGVDNYQAQANEIYAGNLKGKLLLAHGLMDDNVPPSNTMLVIEALEKANKDYDLIVFPDSHHGYGSYSLYMMRRRWDYFVKNLAGKIPPKEYELKMKYDLRN